MWKLGIWHWCCIEVFRKVILFRQASVPWSFRGSKCLNLQGPAVQEGLLDIYVHGTTALCNIRDYAPKQTVSHPRRLKCSCRWWLTKITCINSGSCYWYMQLKNNTNERGVGALHLSISPQQFTTTCRRLRYTTCGKQPLYHGMPEIISIHYIYTHLKMWNEWKKINKMV